MLFSDCFAGNREPRNLIRFSHQMKFAPEYVTYVLNENFEAQHLWDLFEKCGYKVKRAVQRLEAREADKELARLMKIKEGAPILFKERTVYATDGTPVEFTYCYNRGDAYSLTVALER